MEERDAIDKAEAKSLEAQKIEETTEGTTSNFNEQTPLMTKEKE